MQVQLARLPYGPAHDAVGRHFGSFCFPGSLPDTALASHARLHQQPYARQGSTWLHPSPAYIAALFQLTTPNLLLRTHYSTLMQDMPDTSSLPAKLPYTAKMYPYSLEPPLIAQAYHSLFHTLSLMLQCPIPAFQLAYKLALNLQVSSSHTTYQPPYYHEVLFHVILQL